MCLVFVRLFAVKREGKSLKKVRQISDSLSWRTPYITPSLKMPSGSVPLPTKLFTSVIAVVFILRKRWVYYLERLDEI